MNSHEKELTHLDLFSGIGGFALAARWAGFRTIGFCEIDKYCQKVIAKNFLADAGRCGRDTKQSETRNWKFHSTRCCSDIRDINGADFYGVTLVTGGFPCQPFSVAGQRRGAEDDRHLWPEMFRVIGEAQPRWVIAENVTGIINMELGQVLSDLESVGYDFPRDRAGEIIVPLLPACAVDAPHRRLRVWVVAFNARGTTDVRERSGLQDVADAAGGRREQREPEREQARDSGQTGEPIASADTQHDGLSAAQPRSEGVCEQRSHEDVADSEQPRLEGQPWNVGRGDQPRRFGQDTRRPAGSPCVWIDEAEWFLESGMGRVAHGIPSRVDRLKGLGNAIVPQVAFQIIQKIAQIELKQS